jgi:hypothetical protein
VSGHGCGSSLDARRRGARNAAIAAPGASSRRLGAILTRTPSPARIAARRAASADRTRTRDAGRPT